MTIIVTLVLIFTLGNLDLHTQWMMENSGMWLLPVVGSVNVAGGLEIAWLWRME